MRLVERYHFTRISFADPIKRVAAELFNFDTDRLWGPSALRNEADTRYLREEQPRHDWEEQSNGGWKCARCGSGEKDAGPTCRVYLSPRHFLQFFGTEVGRNCYRDVWVDYALRTAAKLSEGGWTYRSEAGLEVGLTPRVPAGVVIPDVRFENEVAALRKAGAKLVRLVRPGAGLSGAAAKHASESEQASVPDDAFDAVVTNDSTLEVLYTKIDALAASWGLSEAT